MITFFAMLHKEDEDPKPGDRLKWNTFMNLGLAGKYCENCKTDYYDRIVEVGSEQAVVKEVRDVWERQEYSSHPFVSWRRREA